MMFPNPVRVALLTFLGVGAPLAAQHGSVVDTVHNLSASGPGEIRSLTERQVCKFCHIPHNSDSPVPMWSRRLSSQVYDTPTIRTEGGIETPAPQPDGSSRLCLSCHDGTIALGEVSGEPSPIDLTGTSVLRPGRSGFLGTDISGSHPISMTIPDEPSQGSNEGVADLVLRSRAEIGADRSIKLDSAGKMQCTTCHDPHADQFFAEGRVPRFWVAPTVTEVCLSCHTVG